MFVQLPSVSGVLRATRDTAQGHGWAGARLLWPSDPEKAEFEPSLGGTPGPWSGIGVQC